MNLEDSLTNLLFEPSMQQEESPSSKPQLINHQSKTSNKLPNQVDLTFADET